MTYRSEYYGVPRGCRNCEHYQPRWRYRFCSYVRCPHDRKLCTIRREPLRKEHFPAKEAVKPDAV